MSNVKQTSKQKGPPKESSKPSPSVKKANAVPTAAASKTPKLKSKSFAPAALPPPKPARAGGGSVPPVRSRRGLSGDSKPRATFKPRLGFTRSEEHEHTTRAPVSAATKTLSRKPHYVSDENGARIRHAEFIGNYKGSVDYFAESFDLNPGLVSLMPWGHAIADLYTTYRFLTLSFHYITRSSTATSGSIIMSPMYDAAETNPTSEAEATTLSGTTEDSPWNNNTCCFDVDLMHSMGKFNFVRSGAVPFGTDVKTYDAGKFLAGAADEVDDSGCGKLWVEYDVELEIPQTSVPTSIESFNFAQVNPNGHLEYYGPQGQCMPLNYPLAQSPIPSSIAGLAFAQSVQTISGPSYAYTFGYIGAGVQARVEFEYTYEILFNNTLDHDSMVSTRLEWQEINPVADPQTVSPDDSLWQTLSYTQDFASVKTADHYGTKLHVRTYHHAINVVPKTAGKAMLIRACFNDAAYDTLTNGPASSLRIAGAPNQGHFTMSLV